jgi:hypothetical protein
MAPDIVDHFEHPLKLFPYPIRQWNQHFLALLQYPSLVLPLKKSSHQFPLVRDWTQVCLDVQQQFLLVTHRIPERIGIHSKAWADALVRS